MVLVLVKHYSTIYSLEHTFSWKKNCNSFIQVIYVILGIYFGIRFVNLILVHMMYLENGIRVRSFLKCYIFFN